MRNYTKKKAVVDLKPHLLKWLVNLKKLTGRPVKVFNMRSEDYIAESGVEYISTQKLNVYMSKFRPKMHIAWRHNIKLTQLRLICGAMICSLNQSRESELR
jgi:hypothetical protein